MDAAHVAVPRIAPDSHPPRAGLQVPPFDGLTYVGAALRRAHGPVHPVGAVLELQGARVAAERDAGMVDGDDQVIELRASEGTRHDDLPEAAQVTALDAVRHKAT